MGSHVSFPTGMIDADELTRRARQKDRWHAYGRSGQGYLALERDATVVHNYQLAHVPGLLQTEDYMLTLFRNSWHRRPDAEIARGVEARLFRQRRLIGEPSLELVAIVDESALRRPVGGVEVMRAQLRHMVARATLPSVYCEAVRVRRVLPVLLALGCVLVLAGCPGLPGRDRVTETDEQRLQVMLNLPIIRDAQGTISQRPGTLINQLGWERGHVAASLPDADPANSGVPVAPDQIKMSTADAMARMRATGWTIMSASCAVPDRDRIAASGRPPEPGQLGADPGLDEWGWSVTAYTHVDGVSYWALLSGGAVRKRIGGVSIRLRAPNVDDPPDLFPDRPAGLPAGSTCIEQPGLPPANVEQGTRIEVSARGGRTKPEIDPDR